jgi:uncharacterized SAM-binding protein YcdF (DUF218 family)
MSKTFTNNKLVYFALLLLITTIFNSCLLFQPSTKKLTKRAFLANKSYDAVIVPGVPFIDSAWDLTMKMRVLWGIHLYKKGYTKKIIMSGSAVYSPYVEAKIMKQYAIAFGIPEQDIIVEDRAQHSTENAWYSYKLAKKLGLQNIALATDPFQTRMLYPFGKRRMKDLKYLPVLFDTLKTLEHRTPQIEYQSLKIPYFKPITETQSFWYRLRGTAGKHIDFNE